VTGNHYAGPGEEPRYDHPTSECTPDGCGRLPSGHLAEGIITDLIGREAPVRATSRHSGATWTGRVVGYCDGPAVTLDTSTGKVMLKLSEVTLRETSYDEAMYVDRNVLHAGLAAILEKHTSADPGAVAGAVVAWLRERLAP
jgi:hypothetical protein